MIWRKQMEKVAEMELAEDREDLRIFSGNAETFLGLQQSCKVYS